MVLFCVFSLFLVVLAGISFQYFSVSLACVLALSVFSLSIVVIVVRCLLVFVALISEHGTKTAVTMKRRNLEQLQSIQLIQRMRNSL